MIYWLIRLVLGFLALCLMACAAAIMAVWMLALVLPVMLGRLIYRGIKQVRA